MLFNTKTLMIDPPSGWRYGFPKRVPETFFSEGFDLGEWLIECGYPAADVPLAIKYSRYWETDNEG
jgi:endonuclease YncB( thermonuclease family)